MVLKHKFYPTTHCRVGEKRISSSGEMLLAIEKTNLVVEFKASVTSLPSC